MSKVTRHTFAWALIPVLVLVVVALVPLRCSVPPTAPEAERQPSAQASVAGAWVSLVGETEDRLTFVQEGGRFARRYIAQGDTVSWWGRYSLMSTRTQGYIQFIIERVSVSGGRDFAPDPSYFFLAAYTLPGRDRLVIEGVTYVRSDV